MRAPWRWRAIAMPLVAAMAVSLFAVAGGAAPVAAASTQCAAPISAAPSGPATVSMRVGPDGPMLVVGSGPNARCALYILTSDQPAAGTFACSGFCATTVWPALLTKGAPIAGPGVNPTLLGTVARKDILTGRTVMQVTYAGMPVYQFFHDTAPGQTNGEDLFDSRVAPAGVWYLVSPGRGVALPGVAHLVVESVTFTGGASGSGKVLAAVMGSNSGEQAFPLYTFSADPFHSGSACTGKCAVFWPPLLTQGRPQAGPGIDASRLGVVVRANGSRQVTYDGHPLYLFVADAGQPGVAAGVGKGAIFGGTGFYTVAAR